jgi:hypothetical protein
MEGGKGHDASAFIYGLFHLLDLCSCTFSVSVINENTNKLKLQCLKQNVVDSGDRAVKDVGLQPHE